MFRLFRRNLIDIVNRKGSIETNLRFLQSPSLKSKASDFTVSYFMKSFGLSLDSALKASKRVRIKTTEIADSVLMFLKNQGFTNTQIARIVSVHPRLVLFNPDEILKPMMDVFLGAGFLPSDLRQVLSKNPTILTCSLEKQILPAIGFLKDKLGIKDIISITNRSRWILHSNLNELMGPKITVLRDHGVPDYRVSAMIKWCPSSFLLNSERFSEALMIVKEMGFDPSSSMFILKTMKNDIFILAKLGNGE